MSSASKELATAQHLLTNSYPAIQDPKILLSVLTHIHKAINIAIKEVLEEKRNNHDIPPYTNTFTGRLNAYKLHVNNSLTKVDFALISELSETLSEYTNAPTAFRKKDQFIIADNDFNLTSLDKQKAHTYLKRAKKIIQTL